MRTSRRLATGIACILAIFAGAAIWRAIDLRAKNYRCITNLKLLHAALIQYESAKENHEFYPPLDRARGELMFNVDLMCPKYLPDSALLISPFHPDARAMLEKEKTDPNSSFGDHSYRYLGYAMINERSSLAWLDALRDYSKNGTAIEPVHELWPDRQVEIDAKQAALEAENHRRQEVWDREAATGIPEEKRTYTNDRPRAGQEPLFLRVDHTTDDYLIYQPIREGVHYYFFMGISPALCLEEKSRIPIVIERPELHGDGGHVLYLDGHVAFVPYPGKFPMTTAFIEGLRSLDALKRET